MPAVTDQTAAGGTPYPNWRPNAVTWVRQDGKEFAPPANPIQSKNTAQTFLTNRQTQDGMLTYVWGPNAEQAPLTFVVFDEGIAVWKQFRDDFRGQSVWYTNELDGVILPVVISDVTWTGDGTHPATWVVEITQQEAEAFS